MSSESGRRTAVNADSQPGTPTQGFGPPSRKKSKGVDLDRGIIHALRINARAPFSRIAWALGVSAQTVARRYARLRSEGALRVVGLVDPDRAGQSRWLLRLSASPGSAQDIARNLAQRTDTSWVRLASGGTEIFSIVHATSDSAGPHPLILREIPRSRSVTDVSAHLLLHTYLGGRVAWHGPSTALSGEQQRQLEQRHELAAFDLGNDGVHQAETTLRDSDHKLLRALQQDGRAALADLAAATGWSQATVARRIAALQANGTMFFDVEIDDTMFGITTQAMLWISVPPLYLEEVAVTLAKHEELAFVAAITGRANLVAHVVTSSPAYLYHYITHRLGSLEAIRSIETVPVMQTLKAASPILAAKLRPGLASRAPLRWQGS
jgi:DNA-binding Lrp family transcriptional regulator